MGSPRILAGWEPRTPVEQEPKIARGHPQKMAQNVSLLHTGYFASFDNRTVRFWPSMCLGLVVQLKLTVVLMAKLKNTW